MATWLILIVVLLGGYSFLAFFYWAYAQKNRPSMVLTTVSSLVVGVVAPSFGTRKEVVLRANMLLAEAVYDLCQHLSKERAGIIKIIIQEEISGALDFSHFFRSVKIIRSRGKDDGQYVGSFDVLLEASKIVNGNRVCLIVHPAMWLRCAIIADRKSVV